ncbi:hybrid sensor histidine kinase/response regulator [Roseibium aquae]|uniref:hybrid sensor histidine kinase/response regulator n=1 Tax=Roseibium aquae TaxID=1323746 RepID=UPI001AD8C25F|nr:PAS domain-containing hybrid sensor histidine kinase/response regulator [Roseibium aquae]
MNESAASVVTNQPDMGFEGDRFRRSDDARQERLAPLADTSADSDGVALPGRRDTDKPVPASVKALQHLALAGMLFGCVFALWLVGSDTSTIRFLSVSLGFFAGGLAVWWMMADDQVRATQALSTKDDKIRRLLARCEELEDRSWELRESDERQSDILATLGDVIIRRDTDGRVVYVNITAADTFGTDWAPQPGDEFSLPEAGTRGGGFAGKDFREPAMGFGDLYLKTVDGPRWFSRLDIPVRDRITDQPLVQTVLRDVTERRLIEEELLAARHTAETSNEAKSRFLATVSHEIRTPLNGILGMAALLRDTRLTKEQSAYIQALETSGETLLFLIDEVLDFSKVEAGKLDIVATPTRLSALTDSVVELLAPKAHAKNLEIGVRLDPNLPEKVTLDATRVRQILFNLAGNGVKFTDEGGVAILIDGKPSKTGGSIVEFRVQDTGIGFDAADAERLFEEFEQIDHGPARKFGGTGLGLAIAQKLTHLMNGTIEARPALEGGAQFVVRLPVPETLSVAGTKDGGDLRGARILIIGSGRVEVPLLKDRLEMQNALVDVHAPGSDALEEGLHGADLLLVDNSALDDAGAWLVASRLAGSKAPAAVLIAPAERDRLPRLKDAGYDAYLIRPVRTDTLIQVVTGLLNKDMPSPLWDAGSDHQTVAAPFNKARSPVRPLRLLVAEDNDINRLLSEALLRKLGHEPTVVADGEAAVAAAMDDDFDAILMDLHMPGLDGLGAIARIREQERDQDRSPVPILVVTADVMEEARTNAEKAGASGYVTKPLTEQAIRRALADVSNK